MLLLTLRKFSALIAHLIGARVPLKELPHIIKRGIRNIRKRLIGQKRLMRRHNHVRHGNQSGQNIIIHNVIRIIMEKYIRFFFIHVQAGCTDLPLLDSFQKRLGINERPSGCVNQGNTLLHLRNALRIHHMSVLIRQRAVERNYVTSLPKLVKRHIFNPGILRRKLVIGNYTHSEPTADVDKNPADFSRADHTDRLAVQIKTGQAV